MLERIFKVLQNGIIELSLVLSYLRKTLKITEISTK